MSHVVVGVGGSASGSGRGGAGLGGGGGVIAGGGGAGIRPLSSHTSGTAVDFDDLIRANPAIDEGRMFIENRRIKHIILAATKSRAKLLTADLMASDPNLSANEVLVATQSYHLRGQRARPDVQVHRLLDGVGQVRRRELEEGIAPILADAQPFTVKAGDTLTTEMHIELGANRITRDDIARIFNVPSTLIAKKEITVMHVLTNTVEVLGGTVGQVVNSRTNKVVWQSEPQQDDERGTTAIWRSAGEKAGTLAQEKIDRIIEWLFDESAVDA